MHTTRGGNLHAGVSARLRALSLAGLLLLMVGFLTATPATANASSGWELILDRPTFNFNGIDFVSEREGWMTAGAGLLHTTDGGATWTEAAKISVGVVDFADRDHGWAAGVSGTIYTTTDGGQTWEQQDSGTEVHIHDIEAISANEAWAAGTGIGFSDAIVYPFPGALLHTTDGGRTWTDVDRPADSWFREVEFVGVNGWALGSECLPDANSGNCRGDVHPLLLRTTDGGATWLESDPGDLSHLVFVDANNGWAAGRECATFEVCSAIVYRTSDGGLTWRPEPLPALDNLQALAFRDAQRGWLLGQGCFSCPAEAWSTDDGGVTWQRRGMLPQGEQGHARTLVISGDLLFAIGRDIALRSTDSGDSWEHVEHPALSFTSLSFGDRSVGYAVSGGQVLRSDDAGRNWTSVGPTPVSRSRVLFIDKNVGFAAGGPCCTAEDRFEIFRTEDGGKTWQRVHRTGTFLSPFAHDAEFVDENHGWFALDNGFLFTSDGGRSWREEPLPEDWSHLSAADLAGPDVAWVIASRTSFEDRVNRLAHTTDGGRTWETEPVEGLYQVEFVDRHHGWYLTTGCGDTGCQSTIHRTDDGGATWDVLGTRPHMGNAPGITFADPLNGWLNESRCDGAGCMYEVLHTADGGRTWSGQLSGELLFGELQFLDDRTGWFLLDPRRGIGIGGGPPNRTQLYHTTDGGGGTVGVPPTPTIQLPKVGTAVPNGGSHLLSFALVVGGLGLSLSAAGMAAARSARRP